MDDIEEKRVYADRTGRTRVFVGAGPGLVGVSVSDDLVGEFGVERRCTVRDVAGGRPGIAVATDEGALLFGEGTERLDVGPATAVGIDGDAVLVGDADGRVVRRPADGASGPADEPLEPLGALDDPIRALDGDLVGTDGGVYRVADGVLKPAGLDAVRNVAAGGTPLIATAEGLFCLAPGWTSVLAGDATLVATDGDGRAHAVIDGQLYACDADAARSDPDAWSAVSLPVEDPPVGIAYGDATYAVTESGTFLVDAGDGWRHHPLGLVDVVGCAVATR